MRQQLDDLLELAHGTWRFRRLGVTAAWGTLLLGLITITILPDKYQASATVFIDTQTALGEATKALTVDANVVSQVQRIREALLGGPQLAKIADETGLTAAADTPRERQRVVEKLRTEIQINGQMGVQAAGTYVIAFQHSNRATSLKVVDRFVNTFVQGALGGKRESSEQAQQFLRRQIAELEKRLATAEDALAAFKKQNVGLMPGEQNDYFKRLDDETIQAEKVKTDLSMAINRRDELQRQLRGEEPLVATGAQAAGVPGAPANPGGDTATRLRQAQQQLDELLLTYTEKHPKVIELKGNIAELQKRLDEELAAARRGDSGAAARTGLTASPVYQNMQMQYNQTRVEIASLQADLANRRQRLSTLRSMINTAPEVEARYSRLNRDYSVIKAQYEALVEQLGRTRLGEEASQTGVVGFDIVDPARASIDPVFPKRRLFAVAALMGSLVVGGGLMFLLNLLRPVFGSVNRLSEATGLPVLGAVSMTLIEQHNAQLRRSMTRVAAAVAGMVLVCGLYIAVQRTLAGVVHSWMA
jgi:polysaccharide chain length determinant protein (PEP-CTERM system associated)